jgi:hypothetical protein
MRLSRTAWIVAAALLLAGGGILLLRPSARAQGPVVEVVKSPTCGCCSLWVEHLRDAGFRVNVRDVDQAGLDAAMRQGGVPAELAACHTATVDGYTIEGHVPVADIQRLLAERPAIRGLAVPGMPGGSPGMESAPAERYQVIAFDSAGGRREWSAHGP